MISTYHTLKNDLIRKRSFGAICSFLGRQDVVDSYKPRYGPSPTKILTPQVLLRKLNHLLEFESAFERIVQN